LLCADEWYTDPRLSANDALKLLVNRIQHMGPVSELGYGFGLDLLIFVSPNSHPLRMGGRPIDMHVGSRIEGAAWCRLE